MAAPGEWFPQQFASGILQLYQTLLQKRSELGEMQQERAARQVMERDRTELLERQQAQNERNEQFQQVMQTKQVELATAHYDAQMKLEFEKLADARKAHAQNAMAAFGRGEPAFFPVGVPLPQVPKLKTPEGEEKEAFDVLQHDIPGVGTFVIPSGKYLDTLQLQKLKEDRQRGIVDQVLQMAQADQAAAHAAYYDAEYQKTLAEPPDASLLKTLSAWYETETKRIDKVSQDILLTGTPEEKSNIWQAVHKRIGLGDAKAGEEYRRQYLSVGAQLQGAADRLAGRVGNMPPPSPGKKRVSIFDQIDQVSRLSGFYDLFGDSAGKDQFLESAGLLNSITKDVFVNEKGEEVQPRTRVSGQFESTYWPTGTIKAKQTTYYNKAGQAIKTSTAIPGQEPIIKSLQGEPAAPPAAGPRVIEGQVVADQAAPPPSNLLPEEREELTDLKLKITKQLDAGQPVSREDEIRYSILLKKFYEK